MLASTCSCIRDVAKVRRCEDEPLRSINKVPRTFQTDNLAFLEEFVIALTERVEESVHLGTLLGGKTPAHRPRDRLGQWGNHVAELLSGRYVT
jgi:hypothetical protein